MISLCIIAKNEEHCIHLPISSVKDIVSEIILLDDYSTDNTTRIASALGAQVFYPEKPVSETGFAIAANEMISHATKDWILILDADEFLDAPHLLHHLHRFTDVDAWALPRRKWYNYSDRQRMEYEAYPDWQPKFFRNIPENKFTGEMHVSFSGTPKKAYCGPHIEHFQEQQRTAEKTSHRKELYAKLADIQGVEIEKGHKRRIVL